MKQEMTRRLLLSGLILFTFSGCAALNDLFRSAFVAPTLSFKSVDIKDVSLAGLTLDLVYTLDNPNPVGVQLASVDYLLKVEGKQVVAGAPEAGLAIPASGQAEMRFPATVRFQDLAGVAETFLTRDFASYEASGNLGVDTPIGIVTLPVQKQGQFEVPKVPAVALAPPRITQLSFTGATVELPLTVTNRNSFPLPISGLSGAVKIAGANVGRLSTGDLGALAGNSSKPVSLPIEIRFLEAAAAAVALKSGSGEVAFDGELRSGAVSVPIRMKERLTFTR
jgi:LEA14-like dessication related protein